MSTSDFGANNNQRTTTGKVIPSPAGNVKSDNVTAADAGEAVWVEAVAEYREKLKNKLKPVAQRASGATANSTTANTIHDDTTVIDDAILDAKLLGLSSNIQPNILNSYDNATYNLKLFMTNESATVESLADETIFVIAESGTSSVYSIEDCEIDTIITPNWRTKNTLATKVAVSITEPLGSTLFDKIRLAASSLGVKDHTRAPMWLEVTFVGYEGADTESYQGGENVLQTASRVYRLSTIAVTAEVKSGGTEYKMNFVPIDETAYFDATRRLEETVNITAGTIGEFFTKLETRISEKNEYTISNLDNNSWPPFKTIEFKTPKTGYGQDMGDWKLRGDNTHGNDTSEASTEQEADNSEGPAVQFKTASDSSKTVVSFNRGTALEAVIEAIIGTTTEGQSYAILGKKTGVDNYETLSKGRDPEIPAILFIVDPSVIFSSYNALAREYNVEIEFNIRSYTNYSPMVSKDQVTLSTDNTERLSEMLTVSNIRKRYEYVYTGLNTEVIDYKLNFDRSWFIQLPIFKGSDRESVSGSAVTDAASAAQQVGAGTTANQGPPGDAGVETSVQRPGARKGEADFALVDRINNSDLISQDVATSTSINTSLFSSSSVRPISNDISRFTIGSEARTADSNASQYVPVNANRGNIYFVEDLSSVSVDRASSKGKLNGPNDLIRDVKARVATTESFETYNAEGTVGSGRSFFAAVMGQAYGRQADMIKIQMEIRGDPYWLGEPSVSHRLNETGHQDLTSGQALFLFTMAFPTAPDGDELDSYLGTGIPNINRQQNGFNGVYQIRTITHKFAAGKFTQKLDAFVDPLTREQDIISIVNNISTIQ